MTTRELFSYIDTHSKGDVGRIRNIKRALVKEGRLPSYNTPLKPINIAWVLYAYCTDVAGSVQKIQLWVKDQKEFEEIHMAEGLMTTIRALELLLSERKYIDRVKKMDISCVTGHGVVHYYGNFDCIESSGMPLRDIDEDDYSIRQYTSIPGDVLRDIKTKL
jgi:hypothetical protein